MYFYECYNIRCDNYEVIRKFRKMPRNIRCKCNKLMLSVTDNNKIKQGRNMLTIKCSECNALNYVSENENSFICIECDSINFSEIYNPSHYD